MVSDQELIEEILGGSQAAMEVLVRNHYKSIYSFVYRKVGNKETAYDLTQEIFMKVIQRIHTYSNKGKFESWLYTIAINHCRDYWGSADYRKTAQQTELPETVESPEKGVHYIFEGKETRRQIKTALDGLPDYQKEAVILKYFHDMKIKDIAQVTSSSVPTVKSRLKQGLNKLGKLLERGEEDGEQKSRKG